MDKALFPAAAPGVVPLPALAEAEEEEVMIVALPTFGRISLVGTTSSGEGDAEEVKEDNLSTLPSLEEPEGGAEDTVRPPPPAAAATPSEAAAAAAAAAAGLPAAATLLEAARGGDRASGPVSTDLPQTGASHGAVVARLSAEELEWAVLMEARARLIKDDDGRGNSELDKRLSCPSTIRVGGITGVGSAPPERSDGGGGTMVKNRYVRNGALQAIKKSKVNAHATSLNYGEMPVVNAEGLSLKVSHEASKWI